MTHSMSEARRAKHAVQQQVCGVPGVSVGIGRTADGGDLAVKLFVQSDAIAKQLPEIRSDLPVEVSVTGEVQLY